MNIQEIDLEKEKQEIIRRYRRLLKHAKPFLKDGDAKIIKKAFNTSLEAHKNMRRKSGEPYIYHPIAVAQICVEEIGLGTTSIVAALLHDVVEDTDMEIRDIERDFGPKVASIIDGLTKISGVFDQGSSQQAENFRKMILTLSDDVRVILIKLADRLHNMRTLESMARDKQLKIASETIYLYAPLAHRLGLNAIKSELEDMYLKYTDSDRYAFIDNKIKETKAARDKFIKDFIAPIDKVMQRTNMDYIIKGRTKSVFSINNKMKKQNIPFEEVFDLFAIRVIVDCPYEEEKAACWRVYSAVTDYYKPNPDRLRDWISTPKANGYESLHTTVMSRTGQWVEVQIRSRRMDDIAERGYAAHWKYKGSAVQTRESGLEAWIRKVREMIENNDSSALEFMDDFRQNLFMEEVFAFTPRGELKVLPNGSTALDFAYEIHTNIGNKCIGAKVNQRLVSLTYKLHNGDQVEILTSNKQKPADDWLKMVATSKARAKIKDALRWERRKVSEVGKKMAVRKLKQMKLEPTSDLLNQVAHFFNCKTPFELFYRIATGVLDHKELKRFTEPRKEKDLKPVSPDLLAQTKEKLKSNQSDMLVIGDDMARIDYSFASCCNPILGDDVFAFVTVSDGIKIHRTNCPNAIELASNFGQRIIKAKWTSGRQIAFLTGVKITGTDRMGILSDLTNLITYDMQVNIRSIMIDTNDGIFEGTLMIFVHDTEELQVLIDKVKKIPDVQSVTRVNAKS